MRDRWAGVLGRLDNARSRAWRDRRPARLDRTFLAGSAVLRADRHALRGYLRRDLSVRGVAMRFARMQRLGHRPDSVGACHGRRACVRLRVVDRLLAVVALGPDGVRLPLPRDRPSRHLITLARTGAGWRIADIRAVT